MNFSKSTSCDWEEEEEGEGIVLTQSFLISESIFSLEVGKMKQKSDEMKIFTR